MTPALAPGDRVTLAEHAHYREGRGLPGTVVQVWGHGRWAIVDVDHHGEITLRTSELVWSSTVRVPAWTPPVVNGPTGPGMG